MGFPIFEPAPNFNFTVTMWDVSKNDDDGIGVGTSLLSAAISLGGSLLFGAFSEVQGIDADLELETYQEGGFNTRPHKFMKYTKYQNLVLKKGVTNSAAIWDWHNQVVSNNQIVRKSGLVTLYERNGLGLAGAGLPGIDRTPVCMWMFTNGLPERVRGPQLNAKGNEIAIETLEISHEGLQRLSLSMIPGLSDISAALGEAVGLGAAAAEAGVSALAERV